MKTNHTDEDIQRAIDAAFSNPDRARMLATRSGSYEWNLQAPCRMKIAHEFIERLPEPPPPVVDGKTPGQVAYEASGSISKHLEWLHYQHEWTKVASAVLATFGNNPASQLAEMPWTEWHGGPCPLKDEEVEEWEYRFKSGEVIKHPSGAPSSYNWSLDGDDIIAYRVLKWKPGHVVCARPDCPQTVTHYEGSCPTCTAKPADTFEAHGKTWTRHTPGDPMPCDGERMVVVVVGKHDQPESLPQKGSYWLWTSKVFNCIGWRYADQPTLAQPTLAPDKPWTPAVSDANPVQDMALGGQMYWRDLARQLAEVWWECHNIGASLHHGDIDTDVSFTVCCEQHGGQCFHADTPHNAWLKAEKWLMSPDRANFPAATLQPA